MSATYSKKDGFFHIERKPDPLFENIIVMAFDDVTNIDELEIKQELEETKLLKRLALVKILLYPFEVTLSKIFLPKNCTSEIKKMQSIHWKFVRGKLNTREFKKQIDALQFV